MLNKVTHVNGHPTISPTLAKIVSNSELKEEDGKQMFFTVLFVKWPDTSPKEFIKRVNQVPNPELKHQHSQSDQLL